METQLTFSGKGKLKRGPTISKRHVPLMSFEVESKKDIMCYSCPARNRKKKGWTFSIIFDQSYFSIGQYCDKHKDEKMLGIPECVKVKVITDVD